MIEEKSILQIHDNLRYPLRYLSHLQVEKFERTGERTGQTDIPQKQIPNHPNPYRPQTDHPLVARRIIIIDLQPTAPFPPTHAPRR